MAKKRKLSARRKPAVKKKPQAKRKRFSKEVERKLQHRAIPFQEKEIKTTSKKPKKTDKLNVRKDVRAPRIKHYQKGKEIHNTVLEMNHRLIQEARNDYSEREAQRRRAELDMKKAYQRAIGRERKKLVKEQIRKGQTAKRVKEIDAILHGREMHRLVIPKAYAEKYQIHRKDRDGEIMLTQDVNEIKKLENELKLFEGRDFLYNVNDSFGIYQVKQSDLVRAINRGENTATFFVEKYKDRVEKYLLETRLEYETEKLTSIQRRRLSRRIFALEKLSEKADMNLEAIEKLSEKPLLKHKGDKNYKLDTGGSYPILIQVVGADIIIS